MLHGINKDVSLLFGNLAIVFVLWIFLTRLLLALNIQVWGIVGKLFLASSWWSYRNLFNILAVQQLLWVCSRSSRLTICFDTTPRLRSILICSWTSLSYLRLSCRLWDTLNTSLSLRFLLWLLKILHHSLSLLCIVIHLLEKGVQFFGTFLFKVTYIKSGNIGNICGHSFRCNGRGILFRWQALRILWDRILQSLWLLLHLFELLSLCHPRLLIALLLLLFWSIYNSIFSLSSSPCIRVAWSDDNSFVEILLLHCLNQALCSSNP